MQKLLSLSFHGKNAHIVCTSILPRLCDHDKTVNVNKINKVNLELKKLCIIKKVQYTNLYRSFFYLLNNHPDSSLYAPRDGLHLNFAGTSLLRKKFINIIKHVSVN
jgi:hypothetical protein